MQCLYLLHGMLSDLKQKGNSVIYISMDKLWSLLSHSVNHTQRDNSQLVSYMIKSENHRNKM